MPSIEPGSSVPESKTPRRPFPDELHRRLWITKGVRFESKARLEKKHLLSTLAVNVLSLSVIGFELLSILVKDKSHAMELLFPIATIVAPVFIIALSAHENAKQYLVHAERMHRSALRISELHSQIEFMAHAQKLSERALGKIRFDYEAVLHDFSSNQDNIDYHYFKALHPGPFLERENNRWRRINIQIRGRIPYYFNVWFVPAAVTLLPVSLFATALWWLITGV